MRAQYELWQMAGNNPATERFVAMACRAARPAPRWPVSGALVSGIAGKLGVAVKIAIISVI
jgi:hypothetical protein